MQKKFLEFHSVQCSQRILYFKVQHILALVNDKPLELPSLSLSPLDPWPGWADTVPDHVFGLLLFT